MTPDGPPGTAGYFVQMGPIPFGSDYQRSRGGTTLHWYGHCIRMLPVDFEMHCRYGVGVDWPIGYDELSPWYDEAEREIGVAADVEDQQRIGLRFTPGYVYPMHKVPPSYLDRWLGERLDGTPVAIGDGTYETGVVPVPGGRNSTPNPAYDGGAGLHAGRRRRPAGDRSALRGQCQLHPGLPGAGQVLGAEDAGRRRRGRCPRHPPDRRQPCRRRPRRRRRRDRLPRLDRQHVPASAVAGTITADALRARRPLRGERQAAADVRAPPTPAIRSAAT